MNRLKVWESLALLVRIGLGFLFLYAAINKIFEPAKFAVVIYNYRAIPVEWLNFIAIVVPWIEAAVGFCLLIGIWVDVAALILSGMTVFFIVLIISAVARGLNIECGCFSLDPQGSLVSWKRVIEDLFMVIGGMFLVIYHGYLKARLSK